MSSRRPELWWAAVACFAVAALLRLVDLGATPLSSAEAGASWSAWRIATSGGEPAPPLAHPARSGVLLGLQTAQFWITAGAGDDTSARLLPALCGCLLVLLPWCARRAIGDVTALTLSALLALDPWLVAYSRVADGTILAAFSAWVIAIGWLARRAPTAISSRARRNWRAACWLAAGLLLSSGVAAWSFVLPLTLIALAIRWWPPGRLRVGATAPAFALPAFAFLTTLSILTTGFLQWEGPPLVSASLDAWLGAASGADVRIALDELGSPLLRFQIVPLLLAVAGFFVAPSALGRNGAVTLAAGLVVGVGMLFLPGRSAAVWLVAQIPVLLLASVGAQRLVDLARTGAAGKWRVGFLRATLALFVLVELQGAAAVARNGDSLRPYPDATEPDVRQLAADLAPLRREGTSVGVVSGPTIDPVLAWYLRREPAIRWAGELAFGPWATPSLLLIPTTDRASSSDGAMRAYRIRRIGRRIELVVPRR